MKLGFHVVLNSAVMFADANERANICGFFSDFVCDLAGNILNANVLWFLSLPQTFTGLVAVQCGYVMFGDNVSVYLRV